MDILLRNKLARGIALIPVGIGSVMSTIYLTNISKPLELLDSLSFSDRPDVEETKIIPEIPEISTEGISGMGGSTAGSMNGVPEGSENAQEATQEEGKKEETTEEQTTEETPSDPEQQEDSGDPEFSGEEPTTVMKQVISNISGLDLSKKMNIEVLHWLFKNLYQGKLAALHLKKQPPSTKSEEVQEGSSSTGNEATEKAKTPSQEGESTAPNSEVSQDT